MDSASPSTSRSDLDSSNDPLDSSASSNYSLTTPSGVPSAQALVRTTKSALEALDDTLGELHGQTTQIALLGGEPQIARDIENLRTQLMDHERRYREGIEEIKLLLKHVESEVVPELLKKQAEEDIAREIDQLVAEQVAICLKDHIPQELQDEVAEQQRILEEVRRELHNSESRRSNARLRTDHGDDSLQTIYKADGTIPAAYPANLQALFDMDGLTSRALMEEYELRHASESRERNLNRLMQFLGVKYQMVRDGSATRSIGLV
ncbi:ATP-binding cassette transporter [Mycena sanguinolenta]|uniref:ATP-binding cassette transporter n=1 Tax=Mycena sanguinolenta TaxID=230812 RepID=A0A8H6Y1L5_9AGAR|nr:ATP-binding cassette transporter [Mycena sanguinolenta]